MGTVEESSPAKASKPAAPTQEAPPQPYPDWSSSMQAYYGAGATPPYFASAVASPTPHPYMWGGQHPMMTPYGTPVPYPAMYPPGGIYAHPNMTMTPGTAPATTGPEGKTSDGKEKAARKKSKGSSGNLTVGGGKAAESGTAASESGNDGATQSAESGSDGSSNASDENNDHDSGSKKGSFNQMLVDGAHSQNHTGAANFQNSVPGNPVVSMAATNLNIGMDLWNPSSAAPGAMKMHQNPSGAKMTDHWVQDEREIKKQKRKQSNRESARRSRLRKQAECEELQQKVEILSNENHSLKDELQRLSEECAKVTSENNSIKEELTRLCGPDALAKLESKSSAPHLQTRGDEGKS